MTGLSAGFCYTVRVVAINNQNFQAASDPIRAQTSRIRYSPGTHADPREAHKSRDVPAIVPYQGSHEALVAPINLTPTLSEHNSLRSVQREHYEGSNDHDLTRQSGLVQKPAEQLPDAQEHFQVLTSRLNELRRETDELHRQDEEEDLQFQDERDALLERRDKLRQDLRDREEGSKDLKKVIAQLERQNTAVQQKKSNHEKALESRQQERRKLHENIQRWDQEVLRFADDMQAMAAERETIIEEKGDMVVSAREERQPDLQAIKQLEEQIRDVGKQVKDLDDNKADAGETSEPSGAGHVDAQKPEDMKAFNERIDGFKKTIQSMWAEYARAQQYLQQLQIRFNSLQSQARVMPDALDEPYLASDNASLQSSPVAQGKALIGRHVIPAPYNGSPSINAPFDPNGIYQPQHRESENQPESNPDKFFREPPSQFETDRLTGGAMVSPSANALLPSDLLGEEADAPGRRLVGRFPQPGSDGRASRPPSVAPESNATETPFLPGLGNMPSYGSSAAVHQHHNNSPGQNDSRSPSMTSSPHDSVSAFHQHRLSEPTADSDDRSLRSNTGSIRAQNGRSRFLGDMFSRQRGKTTPDEGPSLGSLKSYQSRSMPRHYDQGSSLTDTGSPDQRRASPGGLFDTMSHAVLGRRMMYSSRLANRGDSPSMTDAAARHDGFSRPASGVNPWSTTSLEHSNHSRASSVYSAENMLPRPSSESQPFGWKESGLSRSNTTSSARHRMSPWSAYGSRRASAQVEPSGSGSISRLDEDELPLEPDAEAPTQAPIGTKPSRFSMKKTPRPRETSPSGQLNPNARDFKSMFTRDRKAEKANAKGKGKGKSGGDAEASTPTLREGSSIDLKRSHEENSHSATESMEDVTGSVSSNTNDGTPTNRESLMKKLSRKSSQLPGLKPKKSTAPSTPVMGVDDSDEESTSAAQPVLARTPSSITSSPKVSHDREKERDVHGKRTSGFSLSSFKRRSRREGKDAPSISEASVASETGDDTASHDRSERASVDD